MSKGLILPYNPAPYNPCSLSLIEMITPAAGCSLFTTYEALLVGMVGGFIAVQSMPLIDKLHVDDPVGATAVHGGDMFK